MAEPCRNCGAGVCACVLNVVAPSQKVGAGTAASPWTVEAGVTVSGPNISGTGLAADPIEVTSACDQIGDLPTTGAGPTATQKLVVHDTSDDACKLVEPTLPVDSCDVVQGYFAAPFPSPVGATEAAGLIAVVSDGAGGWLCKFVQNTINVQTTVPGDASPLPGDGSTLVALAPNGQALKFTAGCGLNLVSNGISSPGTIFGSVRSSNVTWPWASSPALQGGAIYCDAANRRLYVDPPHAVIPTVESSRIHPAFTTAVVGAFVNTDVEQTLAITNPSATRNLRVNVRSWTSGVQSSTTTANCVWTYTMLTRVVAGTPTPVYAFPPGPTFGRYQHVKQPGMAGTSWAWPTVDRLEGVYDIAPGASVTFGIQPKVFITANPGVTVSPPANQFRYGMLIEGRTI